MNNVVLVGRLTRDPELRHVPGSGTAVTTFSIAVDREFTNKEGKREADFINIEVWNKAAENCAKFLTKGSLVGIQGSIKVDNYQNQAGEKRNATKVRANRVQFLDSKNKGTNAPNGGVMPAGQNNFQNNDNQSFTGNQNGLDPQSFQSIDDDDIPF